MASSKTCIKCGETKGISEFYRHPGMKDGRLNTCKDCKRKYATNYRLENIESVREYDRVRAKRPERIALAKEVTRRFRSSDKRIVACHNAVRRAIVSGAIVRKNCERCGNEHSVAHHESYDRKLDVTWLCQPCHKKRHKEMKEAGIEP